MDDLISRKALLTAQWAIKFRYPHERLRVTELIENAPSVNAVEVVRCKDCIHWYEREEVCLKIYSDGDVSQYAWQNRNPDDFCSYGERKEKGDGRC